MARALNFTNDHAGNTRDITTDNGTRYTHDAWNRLVRVQTVDAGSTFADVASYQYNGLHWRTLRDNGVDERDLFYYSSDWQLIEERRYEYETLPGTLTRIAQQFWGLRYIDDAVARRIDGNADGDYLDTETLAEPDGTWFYLTDVQFSVVAVMTDIATIAERVKYDAYGRARHRWYSDLDGDGDSDVNDYNAQVAAASTSIHGANYRPDADHDRDGDVDGNDFFTFLGAAGWAALDEGLISDPLGPDSPIGYDGYVFAPEAGLNVADGSPQKQALGAYCVRFRWYLPETGRWLQRDPAGYVDGMSTYAFGSQSPLVFVDPSGLADVSVDPLTGEVIGFGPGDAPADSCKCSAYDASVLDDICKAARELAENILKEIEDREQELIDDIQGLPEHAPGDLIKPSLSREGHRALVRQFKEVLRRIRDFADKFCREKPPPFLPYRQIWDRAHRPRPLPDFYNPPVPAPVLVIPPIPALQPRPVPIPRVGPSGGYFHPFPDTGGGLGMGAAAGAAVMVYELYRATSCGGGSPMSPYVP